jgi:hypothetical protein
MDTFTPFFVSMQDIFIVIDDIAEEKVPASTFLFLLTFNETRRQ